MKFYEEPTFRKLNAEWRKKLSQKGFDDLEDHKENLKSFDRRTQSFDDRDQVLEFFSRLDEFLILSHDIIPKKHQRILELYAEGEKLITISQRLKVSDRWVKKIVATYRFILINSLQLQSPL